MQEIILTATPEQIRTLTDFINGHLEEADCPDETMYQIDVAIDEIFGNISKFAYYPETGAAAVRIEIENEPLCAVITFIDRGIPFNPLTATDPDLSIPAKKRTPGGLGLFMVKETMDSVAYQYRDGQNILTIRKLL